MRLSEGCRSATFSISRNTLALRRLSREQKNFYQLALAQTVVPENRLYHRPSGASGSPSSHFARSSNCEAGVFRPRGTVLDPVEAAPETLSDPGRLDRIRSGRKSLGKQTQFFGTEAVSFALQNYKFRDLDSYLFAGWLAPHDPAAGKRLLDSRQPRISSISVFILLLFAQTVEAPNGVHSGA
jgi:hypothetical protein